MKYLSEKVKQLAPYTPGLQCNEGDWIKLNTNENPYPPSPHVQAAVAAVDPARLRLYPDGDCIQLCAAIADVLNVGADNVFCGNSSDEVLALAFQAFFSGKTVAMPDISYGFYPVWSHMYDVTVRIIPVADNLHINAADYANNAGVVIANPNSPTGTALPLCEIEGILQRNPDGVVLMDEAYIDFAGAGIESAKALIGKYDNLLVVRTFSKSYSLAGLRVGFALGNPTLIAALHKVKNAYNSYPLGRLELAAAKAAVLDTAYLQETAGRIIKTREDTARQLAALGYPCLTSHANFLFMQTARAKDLYEYLFQHKILVRHWDKARISDFLRVTIGTNEQMEAFLQCVKQF